MDNTPLGISPPPAQTTYDETPYPAASFPQTHPDKLGAMGRLFGLATADSAKARVLELGCADGTNLLPMAQHAPEARFLGLDASSKQVAAAQAAIAAAQLTNVEIRHQNILEFPASEGKFDYIIVHGIFSWVPDQVRDKILQICRDHLSEHGVAYISYNAFPGWGMRMALRDMLLFHTANLPDAKAKVQQARALTTFLAEAVPTESSPYGMLLKQELDRMKGYADNYMRHDILEETNQPFYFYQFMQRAMGAGLQYLSETSLDQMLAANFPEKVAATLEKVGDNIIAKEQYMDFVRNRNFRQTLLCHAGKNLARQLSPSSLKSFFYTSTIAKPEFGSVDLKPGVSHAFKMRTGNLMVNADHPFTKSIFDVLANYSLQRVSFQELLQQAREKSVPFLDAAMAAERAPVEEATLAANLITLYAKGVIDIHADRPSFLTKVPEKPEVTPLARHQAVYSQYVVSHAHQPIRFEILARAILAVCDGQNDQSAIVERLVGLAREGKLRVAENDKPVEDDARLREVLAERVNAFVPQLTAFGFFVE